MKPIIGITMGDASGIGPEIIVKTLSALNIYEICHPIVIGDAEVMRQAARIVSNNLKINAVSVVGKAKFKFGTIDVLDLQNIDFKVLKKGQVDAMSGGAAVEFIKKAVELALRNEIHAIVTAPINKEAMNKAGHDYAGHTELLAHLTKTTEYAMMLIARDLRVIHVTTHVSLSEACDMIKKDRILKAIRLAHGAMRDLGIGVPRIAIAGLNPHAGEGGLFGLEEKEEIAPAIQEARSEGINAMGPYPPDTVFARAKGGGFDAVVAMYHDQGHIPIKILGLEWNEAESTWDSVTGVNVTIGLPIIRSSVDHGTAFGKAWKGTANPHSMIEALEYAVRMAKTRFMKDSSGFVAREN